MKHPLTWCGLSILGVGIISLILLTFLTSSNPEFLSRWFHDRTAFVTAWYLSSILTALLGFSVLRFFLTPTAKRYITSISRSILFLGAVTAISPAFKVIYTITGGADGPVKQVFSLDSFDLKSASSDVVVFIIIALVVCAGLYVTVELNEKKDI